jgi:CubicO group peptidase (beta-lactamase class C family)
VKSVFRPVSAAPLVALRVALPLLLLLHLLWLSSDLLALHGGIIPRQLTELLHDPRVPGLETLTKPFALVGIGAHAATAILLALYTASLLALVLGFHTRASAFVAWALHLGLMTSGFASFYGVDQITNSFLFYLFVFSFRCRQESIALGALRLVQLHLCVIYLAAGLDKARGIAWWNGEAIWQTLSQPAFGRFDLHVLASHPWIPMLVGWATLIVEIGYAGFVWLHPTRRMWCLAAIAFHLGTAIFMGLVFFASVMIVLTSCLFLEPQKIWERVRPRRLAYAPVAAMFLPWSPALDALVERVMARDHVPGVAVGVVDDGQLVYGRGYGERDVEARLPVTLETLFPLGSASKAFTATALAILADEGAITLDAPVRTYLPDFALADPFASATVTTRDILTHRTGLPRHDLFWYEAPFSRDELYQRLRFLEPSGPPHARWRYNSAMFVAAGRVVERTSGETWEGFVQTRILDPIGMRRTRLSMDDGADHAVAYDLHDGHVHRMLALGRTNVIAPAGAVRTSVNDLVRWMTFHTMRSPPLLGEDAWRDLHRGRVDMPPPSEFEVRNPQYALGWIRETYRGHELVMHNGAIDGFTVHVGFLPESHRALVVLMNRDLATAALMAIAYSAYDRMLGLDPIDWEGRLRETSTTATDVRTTAALDFDPTEVAGRYTHPAYGALTIRSNGDELAMDFRTLRFTLAYQGDGRFVTREPIAEGGPHLTVRFSKGALAVAMNFDEGDPVEVFTLCNSGTID